MKQFLIQRIESNQERIKYFKDCLEVVYDFDKCRNYKMVYRDLEFFVYKRKRRLIPSSMYANFMNFVLRDEWVEIASSLTRNKIP